MAQPITGWRVFRALGTVSPEYQIRYPALYDVEVRVVRLVHKRVKVDGCTGEPGQYGLNAECSDEGRRYV